MTGRSRKKSGESAYETTLGALGVALAAGIPTIPLREDSSRGRMPP